MGEGVEKLEPSNTAGRNVQSYSYICKNVVFQFLKVKHIVQFRLHEVCRIVKSTESRFLVARGQGRGSGGVTVSLGGDKNVLKFHGGNDCTTL